MAYQVFAGKERVGITIERFKEWIRLRWTHNKKTSCLTIGKDGKDSLKAARAKAQTIDADITFERFDPTLFKYGKPRAALHVVAPEEKAIALRELWDRFLTDKLPNLKAQTQTCKQIKDNCRN